MASDDEILDQQFDTDDELAKLMEELNIDSSDSKIPDDLDDLSGIPELSEFSDGSDLSDIPDINDILNEDEEDSIPSEEMIDMDEIDAILSDISDVHPERNVSAEELEERIAKYEEDPEAAEEALLQEAERKEESDAPTEEETASEEIPSTDAPEVSDAPEMSDEPDLDALLGSLDSSDDGDDSGISDDFLSSLENVDELLADVENKANEESERLKAEASTEEDQDLDEINDILQKSDNNEAVNDDLLSMIEGMDLGDEPNLDDLSDDDSAEGSEEGGKKGKKEKKKKEKKEKKKKEKKKGKKGSEKEGAASEGEGASSDGDLEFDDKDPAAKKGLFSKIFGFMFEESEDEEEGAEGKEGAEGGDGKKAKKDKKGKKAKGGKGKGGTPADENAAIEAELEEEDKKSKKKKKDKKEKKDKKPDKAKKPKKEKKPEEQEEQKSGIKKPAIIVTMFFCITVLAIVLILCMAGPKFIARKEATLAYYSGDYETASNKLYGMKLSKSEELIYRKSSLLYRLDLFLDKVEAYELIGDEKKTLDSLFAAYEECGKVYTEAQELSITEEVDSYKSGIAQKIGEKYGLSVSDIDEICEMKPVYYTIAVENLIAGRDFRSVPNTPVEPEPEEVPEEKPSDPEENNPDVSLDDLEDLLPEEMDLIP